MYESANTNRTVGNQRLVFAFSYIAAGRLRRPLERPDLFAVFVPFVVKTPFVSAAPLLL
jgi:hypothetical protein